MTALILATLLSQSKPVSNGLAGYSTAICWHQAHIAEMKKDIAQAHANAKLSGAIDLGRVNKDAEIIEEAQALIRQAQKELAKHGDKQLSCGNAWVRNIQHCVDEPDDQWCIDTAKQDPVLAFTDEAEGQAEKYLGKDEEVVYQNY